MELETPRFNLSGYSSVYEPSEDTFLLLDALEAEIAYLRSLEPIFCVEIGCGSGVVIAALAEILKNSDAAVFFATDVNEKATEAAASTARLNDVRVDCVAMDLLGNFRRNVFDVVLFNPPYVATDPDEIAAAGNGIGRAFAGGIDGRQVIDRFLARLDGFLSDRGVCYVVLLKENRPEEIANQMRGRGFLCEVIKERKIPGEHLYVVKFSRKTLI